VTTLRKASERWLMHWGAQSKKGKSKGKSDSLKAARLATHGVPSYEVRSFIASGIRSEYCLLVDFALDVRDVNSFSDAPEMRRTVVTCARRPLSEGDYLGQAWDHIAEVGTCSL